jgi:hypothetical protein
LIKKLAAAARNNWVKMNDLLCFETHHVLAKTSADRVNTDKNHTLVKSGSQSVTLLRRHQLPV